MSIPRMAPILVALVLAPGLVMAAPASSSQAIVNGDLERDTKAVASMAVLYPGDNLLSSCTGTLIGPDLILTAAHCIDNVPLGDYYAYFGNNVADYPDRGEAYLVAELIPHPQYSAQNLRHDIALVRLARRPDERAHLFRRQELEDEDLCLGSDSRCDDEDQTQLFAVGFGVTGDSGQGGGFRRSTTVPVWDWDEDFLIMDSRDSGVCNGDSGGPGFFIHENGEYEQWTVASFVFGGCEYGAGLTRVDTHARWIRDYFEDEYGTRDPCEANDFYGDGICDTLCPDPDEDCFEPEEEEPIDVADGGQGCSGCNSDGGPEAVGPGASFVSRSPLKGILVLLPLALLLAWRRQG